MGINSVNITFGHANTKDWMGILSAMLTPFVAIFGLYIAFQQWQISKTLEAFQVEQHKYDNFEIPLRELTKKYLSKLISDDKEINKKEITIKCIDEICSIFDKNHYMFDSDDCDLIEDACNNLKRITNKLEPIKDMDVKKIWKAVCEYYHYLCLLIMPLIAYMPHKKKPYTNIFDVLWTTILIIIQFFIPHWIDRKIIRHVMPKIILIIIIWQVGKYILSLIKQNKQNKKECKEYAEQLT